MLDLVLGKRQRFTGCAFSLRSEQVRGVLRASGKAVWTWPLVVAAGAGPMQELAILKGLFESIDELAAKDFSQHLLGQEVVVPGTNPAGVIGREATGRHHTMDMWMGGEFLTPRMQDSEETNLCTEVSGIASNFEQRFCTAAEQERVETLQRR